MTTQTASLQDEMSDRWRALGAQWLADHPITNPPGFFELDPEEVGPSRRTGDAATDDGWYLMTVNPETGEDDRTIATFPDVPEATNFMPHVLAYHSEVQRVQLWQGGACIWAARRRS